MPFVGAGALVANNSGSLSVALPAHSAGDFLMLVILQRTTAPLVPVVPAGWDLLGITDDFFFVYGKIAGGSEPSPILVTTSSSTTSGWGAKIFAYSGVSAAMIDSGLRWNIAQNVAALEATAPDTRAATDGAVAMLLAYSTDENTLALKSGSEQGFTQRTSDDAVGFPFSLLMADKTIAAAGDIAAGATVEQTIDGPDSWRMIGVLTLMADGEVPTVPRLISMSKGFPSNLTTEVTIPLPLPPSEDDLIVVVIDSQAGGTPTITIPGYTQHAVANRSTNRWDYMYYKVSDGTEIDVKITNSQGNFGWIVGIEVWREVDPDTPFDVVNTENDSAASTTFVGPSVTPASDGTVVLSVGGCHGFPAAPAFSNKQGFQPSFLGFSWKTSISFDAAIMMADKYVAIAGPTTAPTWATGGGSFEWVGISTALRPLPGPPPPVPPDAPINVTATPVSSSAIRVDWSAVTGATGYRVERSDDGIGGWADVSGPITDVTFTDTGLTPSTTYFYRVVAFNDGGDSDPSSVVSATTFPEATPIPNPNPGEGWLRHPDEAANLDMAVCVTESYTRTRPFNAVQPIGGGLPTVVTGVAGGRDYSLVITTRSVAEQFQLERILESPIVYYQPPCDRDVWLAPDQMSIQVTKVKRIRQTTVTFVEVLPQPQPDPESFFELPFPPLPVPEESPGESP